MTEAAKLKARLEVAGIRFLLWQKRCVMATMERGYDNGLGKPDILGLTPRREIIEVEIKVSVSDLRANSKKAIQQYFVTFPERGPNYFYYLVPKTLGEKAVEIAEPHAGVLVLHHDEGFEWSVLRKPKRIHQRVIGLKRAAELMRNQSSTVLALTDKLFRANLEKHQMRKELESFNQTSGRGEQGTLQALLTEAM